MTPDLLTLIQTGCEGTAAEGLAPKIMDLPVCVATCRHFTGPWCDIDRGAVCEPAVEALARLAAEGAAEVERLTGALRVATASPPLPSNGCEPAAVEGIDLVWLKHDGWHLCKPSEPDHNEAPYSAWTDWRGVRAYELLGAHMGRYMMPTVPPNDCRQIADWARADGYRVPPHPLGWDVGGGE